MVTRLQQLAACITSAILCCVAQAGPVDPWAAAPPVDNWMAPLPRPSRDADAARPASAALSGPPMTTESPWPGFAYGLPRPDASPQFELPAAQVAKGGAPGHLAVDLPAVLGLDDPSRWPAMTLSGGAASADPYASEVAGAGTAAEQEDPDDIFAVIPEPATLGLLGLGGALALLRRRRR